MKSTTRLRQLISSCLVVLLALFALGCDQGGGSKRSNNPSNPPHDPIVQPVGPGPRPPIETGSFYSGEVTINDSEIFAYEDFLDLFLRLCQVNSRRNNCENWTDGARMDLVFFNNRLPSQANLTYIAYDDRTRDFFRTAVGPLFRFYDTQFRFRHYTGVPANPAFRGTGAEIRLRGGSRRSPNEITIYLNGQPGQNWMNGDLVFRSQHGEATIGSVRLQKQGHFQTFYSQYSSHYTWSSSYSYRYGTSGFNYGYWQ